MADESDGIEEALESTVRLAVMAGARLGSRSPEPTRNRCGSSGESTSARLTGWLNGSKPRSGPRWPS